MKRIEYWYNRGVKQIRFTRKGFEELKKKYEELKNARPPAVLDLKKARDMGDLSENGYYKAARSKLSGIDSTLRHLLSQIKGASVVESTNKDFIGIGSKVILRNKEKELVIELVGDLEANPAKKKISLLSPIGLALEGKKTGDKIEITTPQGKIFYIVTKIS